MNSVCMDNCSWSCNKNSSVVKLMFRSVRHLQRHHMFIRCLWYTTLRLSHFAALFANIFFVCWNRYAYLHLIAHITYCVVKYLIFCFNFIYTYFFIVCDSYLPNNKQARLREIWKLNLRMLNGNVRSEIVLPRNQH